MKIKFKRLLITICASCSKLGNISYRKQVIICYFKNFYDGQTDKMLQTILKTLANMIYLKDLESENFF